jgi:hypothetical protein
MRLLIAEKPHLAKELSRRQLIEKDTEIVSTYGHGLWHYKVDNIDFTEIPFSSPPEKIVPRRLGSWRNLLYKVNGEVLVFKDKDSSKEDDVKSLNDLISTINSRMIHYSEIIVFVDPDRTGIWSAKQIIDQLSTINRPPINTVIVDGLSEVDIKKAYDDRVNQKWEESSFVQKCIEEQKIKTAFDYWWNVNSKMVLSELCKWTGLKSNKIISKNELMLIWILSLKEGDFSKNYAFSIMKNWQGSGKYNDFDIGPNVIGSPMSISTIFSNTIERGAVLLLIDDDGKESYKMSQNGMSFVARLHKGTMDPDLPYRLEEWIQDRNSSACKKYIRTIFGRQLRFQRNQINCWGIVPALIKQFEYQHGIIAIIGSNKSNQENCSDELLLRDYSGNERGTLKVEARAAGPYKVSLNYDKKSIIEYVTEYNDPELMSMSSAEFVMLSQSFYINSENIVSILF